jgi:hypothetical protein
MAAFLSEDVAEKGTKFPSREGNNLDTRLEPGYQIDLLPNCRKHGNAITGL